MDEKRGKKKKKKRGSGEWNPVPTYDPVALKGKRKKKILPHPNPLFLQWLKEWQEEARAKDNKNLVFVYTKAIKSLKKYPAVLACGQSCAILENFGPKTCKMLDERLQEHRSWLAENADPNPSAPVLSCATGRKRTAPLSPSNAPSAPQISPPTLSIPDPGSPPGKKPRRRPTSASRDYVPSRRGGAYALLLALYHRTCSAENSDAPAPPTKPFHLSKRRLMKLAQPLCDASFFKPDDVDSFYSAWSSMSTLLTKELVVKRSSPAQYSLTLAGRELAARLKAADEDLVGGGRAAVENVDDDNNNIKGLAKLYSSIARIPNPEISSVKKKNQFHDISIEISSDEEDDVVVCNKVESRSEKNGISMEGFDQSIDPFPTSSTNDQVSDNSSHAPLSFVYVDAAGNDVLSKDSAVVGFDADVGVTFLVKSRRKDLKWSGKWFVEEEHRGRSGEGGEFVVAFLKDEDCPEMARGGRVGGLMDDDGEILSEVMKMKTMRKKAKPGKKNLNDASDSTPGSTINVVIEKNPKSMTCTTPAPETVSPQASANIKGTSRRISVDDAVAEMRTRDTPTSGPAPQFVLRSGEFDLVLLVDTGEVACSSDLSRNGVVYETRRLAVGDFLWIARERGRSINPREIVLDFIIERKRMDDLSSSIVDGRFREQKHRLRASGLKRIIYLIEEFRRKPGSLPVASLRQAISNTQIIDGFHVVHCRDPKDVAAYLSLMTRYLSSVYASKTLRAISRDKDNSHDDAFSLDAPILDGVAFAEFQRACQKNGAISAKELFAKQLMVLSGISGVKAYAIVQTYPTPELLMRAYDALPTAESRENLLKDIKCGVLGRKLGPVISRVLAQLYASTGDLT